MSVGLGRRLCDHHVSSKKNKAVTPIYTYASAHTSIWMNPKRAIHKFLGATLKILGARRLTFEASSIMSTHKY